MNLTKSVAKTMSSLEIAQLTGKNHYDVMRDIKNVLDQAEIDTRIFAGIYLDPQNRERDCFDLPKRECDLVVSGYSVKYRLAIIDRWHELESKQVFQIPQTLGDALQLAADQAKQLELQAPKVAFVDNLVDKTNLLTATQVASKHKLSAVKLNKLLDEIGGVYNKSVKRGRTFCHPWVAGGYGEMKQTELGYDQSLFTPRGEVRIHEMLISEGII